MPIREETCQPIALTREETQALIRALERAGSTPAERLRFRLRNFCRLFDSAPAAPQPQETTDLAAVWPGCRTYSVYRAQHGLETRPDKEN